MKRGYTKAYSGGKLGEEQRRDKGRRETMRYHIKRHNFDRVDELLTMWKGR